MGGLFLSEKSNRILFKKSVCTYTFLVIGLKFLNQSSQCESWLGSFAEFFPFKLEICAGFEFPRRRRHA